MAGKNEEKIYGNLKTIEEWAFLGIAEKEMAELLGMGYTTFRELKKKIPALSAVLKKSADEKKKLKKKQVEEVEKTLLQRCLGYNAKVKKAQKLKKPLRDEDGEIICISGKPVMEDVLQEVTEEQHVPADVGAIKFFLLNQAKENWKNDPDRLELEKKRVANDTKRTKIAEAAANGQNTEGKTIEDILEEAEQAADLSCSGLGPDYDEGTCGEGCVTEEWGRGLAVSEAKLRKTDRNMEEGGGDA